MINKLTIERKRFDETFDEEEPLSTAFGVIIKADLTCGKKFSIPVIWTVNDFAKNGPLANIAMVQSLFENAIHCVQDFAEEVTANPEKWEGKLENTDSV